MRQRVPARRGGGTYLRVQPNAQRTHAPGSRADGVGASLKAASFKCGSGSLRGGTGKLYRHTNGPITTPKRRGFINISTPLIGNCLWAPFKNTSSLLTFLPLSLTDWPQAMAPPPACPVPSQTRWRRPVESRPRLGFAEADFLSHFPFGCHSPRAGGQGPGGDRGTCVAGPRARAQPAPPPPGPGPAPARPFPIPSHPPGSPPDLTRCPALYTAPGF